MDEAIYLERARETYLEVLDATKHQDDKVGRFLAAIAFLTGGTIAFAFTMPLAHIRYKLAPNVVLPLPAIFVAIFLACVAVSVVLLLLALGPNLTMPQVSSDGGKARPRSYLFFLPIAEMSLHDWQAMWRKPDIQARVADGYVREAHNLATKTNFKFSRTNEARAAFTFALLSFTAAVVLGCNAVATDVFAVADANGLRPPVIAWSLRPRLLTAAVFGAFGFLIAYDWFRLDQHVDNWYGKDGSTSRKAKSLRFLPGAVPLYLAGAIVPVYGQARVLGAAMCIIGTLGMVWAIWPRLLDSVATDEPGLGEIAGVERHAATPDRSTVRWVRTVILGGEVCALAPAVLCGLDLPHLALGMAGGVVVLVEGPRFMNASIRWRKLRRTTP